MGKKSPNNEFILVLKEVSTAAYDLYKIMFDDPKYADWYNTDILRECDRLIKLQSSPTDMADFADEYDEAIIAQETVAELE